MMSLRQILFVAALLGAGATAAHHSFSPVYDGSRTITVAGVVTEFKLVNPHAHMALDVTEDSGSVSRWNVEFDGRLNLTNHGWDDDTIKVGERLIVTGNPTHTGSQQMFFTRLQRSDGSVMVRGGNRIDSIEDERRRRREERQRDTEADR